jgi:redox-sensitive bicupin YhaK (pirin superfamily)
MNSTSPDLDRREMILGGAALLAACAQPRVTRPQETAMNVRPIRSRTAGSAHGFIRRMVSPGDLGASLKPFVFLDHLQSELPPGAGFPYHPHSGIATLSFLLNADATYEDTTGARGLLRARGLEWMQSGGGVWHVGNIQPRERVSEAFQLWVALPAALEEAPAMSMYVPPEEVPVVDGVTVMLGAYGGARSPIPAVAPMNYLHAELARGRRWVYAPPSDHDLAWCYVHRGQARVQGEAVSGELVTFADGHAPIAIEALSDAAVLLGSARRHPHPLVLGTSSVHTRPEALSASLQRIRALGEGLRRAGRV